MPAPKAGHVLFVVPGSSALNVPTGGARVQVGGKAFLFPRGHFVVGVQLVPVSASPFAAASLELQIEDETQANMFADGSGATGTHRIPMLAAQSLTSDAPLPLQRPVNAGDAWAFFLTNTSGADIRVAALLLYIENEAE